MCKKKNSEQHTGKNKDHACDSEWTLQQSFERVAFATNALRNPLPNHVSKKVATLVQPECNPLPIFWGRILF